MFAPELMPRSTHLEGEGISFIRYDDSQPTDISIEKASKERAKFMM
jgi:hypothetical protein